MKTPSRIAMAIPALASLATALLTGCGGTGPQPWGYSTSDSADYWRSGVRVHPSSLPGYDFTLSVVESDRIPALEAMFPRPLAFSIGVRSRSQSKALLDPADFHLLAPCGDKPITSLDPETALRASDQERMAEISRHNDDALVTAAVEVPLAFFDIAATFAGKTSEQAERDDREYEERRQMHKDEDARHQRALAGNRQRHDSWATGFLRKTTLLRDEETGGILAFAAPAYTLPPDTLILLWRRPEGGYADLGTLGRPHIDAPAPRISPPPDGLPYVGIGSGQR